MAALVLTPDRHVLHSPRTRSSMLAATYACQRSTQSRYFADGGLMSYGAEALDLYRRAASTSTAFFKGEKPAELPVQQPTKYRAASSISRPPRRSVSPCRRRCSPAPTR